MSSGKQKKKKSTLNEFNRNGFDVEHLPYPYIFHVSYPFGGLNLLMKIEAVRIVKIIIIIVLRLQGMWMTSIHDSGRSSPLTIFFFENSIFNPITFITQKSM